MNIRSSSALLCAVLATLPTLASAVDTTAQGNFADSARDGAMRNGVQLQGAVLQGPVLQGPGLVLQGPVLQGVVLQGPGLVLQGPVLQGIVLQSPGLLQQDAGFGSGHAGPSSYVVLEGRPWASVQNGPFAAITSSDVRVRLPQSR